MKICVVANFSDRRCGFKNFADQAVTALRRAGHDVTAFDGTYSAVYERREAGVESFLPPDIETYDILHLVWSAQTLNHYSGATWPEHPLRSIWDGGPSDAYCPFIDAFPVKWTCYDRSAEGYHESWYPIPDWIEDLPEPAETFTVGATSVRGDGLAELRTVADTRGWALNLPMGGQWLSLEDEVRRLARSTVNVSWYNTPAVWKDRAGAPSMALASRRPLLISHDSLLSHLWEYPDLYHGRLVAHGGPGLAECLDQIHDDWLHGTLRHPSEVYELSWVHAVRQYEQVWRSQ